MNVKEEIVKNSQILNEVKEHEIKYDFHRIADFRKENLKPAQKNLEKNEKEEIIRDAIEKSSDLKKLFSEYEKDENLLDVLASIWLAFDQEDEDLIRKYKLNDFQNKELFMKRMSERLKYARRTALEQRTSRPKPEDIIKIRSDKKSPLERREEEERKREEEAKEKEKETDETPEEEETDETPEEETPEEEADETPEDKEERKPKRTSIVDEEDYPPPMETSKKLETFKDGKIQEVEEAFSNIEEPNKEQEARYEKVKSEIEKVFSEESKKIKDQDRGYSISPTRNSATKASVNAEKISNNAKIKMNNLSSKFRISFMPGRLQRGVKRVKEAGQAMKKAADKVTQSRPSTLAGEKAKAVIDQQKQKMAANTIEKNMGTKGDEKRKEYLNLVFQGKQEEAEKIRQQALEIKKHADFVQKNIGDAKRKQYVDLLSQGKQEEAEKIRREAFDKSRETKEKQTPMQAQRERMRKQEERQAGKQKPETASRSVTELGASGQGAPWKSLRTENNLLRHYGKRINELADNPATRDENDNEEVDTKSKEALKIAGTSMGKSGAEEYMKLIQGSASDKQKAVDMLQRAEEEQERTKKEMGIKEQNESLKRTIKFLYN